MELDFSQRTFVMEFHGEIFQNKKPAEDEDIIREICNDLFGQQTDKKILQIKDDVAEYDHAI